MIASLALPISAEGYKEIEKIPVNAVSEEIRNELNDIPFFVTTIPNITDITDEQKQMVSNAINTSAVNEISEVSNNVFQGKTVLNSEDFNVSYSTDVQREEILSSPIYADTLEQAKTLIDQGVTVKYLNFFISESMLQGNLRYNANDPSYWENNCPSFGTYNGYKLLYTESSIGVETSEVTLGNAAGSLQWTAIAKKTFQVLADHFVKNTFYKAVKALSSSLSTIMSSYSNPLQITYGASGGYIKAEISGDIYTRTILIRDDLNRVDGYAYYNWGKTQRLVVAMRMKIKYPYKQNASGTYEYEYPSYTSSKQTSYTPGHNGNSTIYRSIVSLYENTTGYFTHDEYIDVHSFIATLLN